MMKKKLMIQQKTDSPICLACTMAKMLQCLPHGEISIIVSHHYDDILEKRSYILLVIPSSLLASFGHLKISPADSSRFSQKVKIIIHFLLFTIHCYCLWYCSLSNFAYLRGDIPYIKPSFKFSSRARILFRTTTTLL